MENEQLEPLAIEWIRKIQSVKVDGWCFFLFFFFVEGQSEISLDAISKGK